MRSPATLATSCQSKKPLWTPLEFFLIFFLPYPITLLYLTILFIYLFIYYYYYLLILLLLSGVQSGFFVLDTT